MKTYYVKRLPDEIGQYPLKDEFFADRILEPWNKLDEAILDCYPWDSNGYRPVCKARLGWNASGLHLLMYAMEETIRAEVKIFGGRVCEDSCMEFFCVPNPSKTAQYFNCECTSNPTMLIGVGTDRYDRVFLETPPKGLEPCASEHKNAWWAVSYSIPSEMLWKDYGCKLVAATAMQANFFICGDSTEYTHYGMWNNTDTQLFPEPDFHQPSMFGKLVLVDD